MKFAKLIATAAAGALALGLAGCGSDNGGDTSGNSNTSTKTFKLAFNQTEEHPQYLAAVEFGKRLEEVTEGRYSIDAYANETLGTQGEVIENVSNGSVEFAFVAGPILEGFNDDFIIYNLPYMFDTIEAQTEVFADMETNGDLFSSLEESKNITVLAALHAGVRNIYGSKAVLSPDDLSGMKIRIQESDSQVKMIELMGGVASPMSQGEVYSALQTGVLDGAENNETVFHALKHDEVVKHYSYTRHMMMPDYLVMSTEALNAMSDEDRQALLDLIPEIQKMANEGLFEYVADSKAAAIEAGAEFHEDVDREVFKESVQPLIDESVNNEVREAIYARIQQANEDNA